MNLKRYMIRQVLQERSEICLNYNYDEDKMAEFLESLNWEHKYSVVGLE